jgi:hypothetical protein
MPRLTSLPILIAVASASFLSAAPARPELEIKTRYFASAGIRQQVSGIDVHSNQWTVIADDKEDRFLYRVDTGKSGFYKLDRSINFDNLWGFKAYMDDLATEHRVSAEDRRFDLEGIARCANDTYLINERVRHVLLIKDRKSINRAPIDFSGVSSLWEGGSNAGFEGIAADCDNQILYVGKERSPRLIIKIDMKTWKIVDSFDFSPSDRVPQHVINTFTGEGLLTINADISDLTFQDGYLYVLERSGYEIAKLDPKTRTVLARVSFLMSEKSLYETGEPYGVAEGLALTPTEIIVAFDNNGTPLSGITRDKLKVSGNGSAIFTFKRPDGF